MSLFTRYGVRAAVTWRILTELVRRHQNECGLRVYETHPGGGQYDCLTLVWYDASRRRRHLCDFNVASQHIHVWEPYERPRLRLGDLWWPDQNDYVLPFLSACDPKEVVDAVEALLGLPEGRRPQPTTPPILVLRIIASLMERNAFARRALEARCCWHDSSGMGGSFLHDWVAWFPSVQEKVEAHMRAGDYDGACRAAGRLWRVSREGLNSGVILDLATGRARVTDGKAEQMDLWGVFHGQSRSIRDITDHVAAFIDA